MGKIRMHASKPNYHINMIIFEDLPISVFFVENSFPAGIYCTLYIFWMASLQGRSWRSGQPGRWVNPPKPIWHSINYVFSPISVFLTSHQIDLALALSHLVRDGRWPIPCPSGTKLATRAGRNLVDQPLLRVAIIVLEQEINLNVVASSALVRLWVCGCTEAVSPSECQCGPQVWRPSWAMGASSRLPLMPRPPLQAAAGSLEQPLPPSRRLASQANQPEKAFMRGLRVHFDEHQFGSCYMEQKQGR